MNLAHDRLVLVIHVNEADSHSFLRMPSSQESRRSCTFGDRTGCDASQTAGPGLCTT